jgi:glycosyltransferase involved in cell wall biosynthesis
MRKKAVRIGIIGRIAPEKGQTDFLRAAAVIAERMPEARFVICGAPMFSVPGYVDEVRRLAAGLPVEFLGWSDDLDAVLADLDALVVPSAPREATTRVILEAFSAGVLVVAYANGGIPEIVQDSENGFLVPECEPDALARKIVDAVAQDSSRVIARARKDWESKYTLARFQEQVINVIAGCLATSGVRPTASASAIERDGLRVMRDTQGSGLVSNRREPARKWGAGGGA